MIYWTTFVARFLDDLVLIRARGGPVERQKLPTVTEGAFNRKSRFQGSSGPRRGRRRPATGTAAPPGPRVEGAIGVRSWHTVGASVVTIGPFEARQSSERWWCPPPKASVQAAFEDTLRSALPPLLDLSRTAPRLKLLVDGCPGCDCDGPIASPAAASPELPTWFEEALTEHDIEIIVATEDVFDWLRDILGLPTEAEESWEPPW